MARNAGESDEDMSLCYMVFDILFVKGARGDECNLMTLPLS